MPPSANKNEFLRIDDTLSFYPDVTRDSYSTKHVAFPWSSFPCIEPTGVGAGLYNSGNTCFIASVLQCLTHTVPLLESLRSYKSHKPCNCGRETLCVMQALQDHIKLALKSSGSYITTNQFRDNLNHFSPDFQINNQEDAYEFLQSFLDKLERCLIPRNRPGSVSSQEVSIVDYIFGGRLMSRLHCRNCNSFSDTLETSLGWSLEIEDVDNLLNALESFTRVEQLEDQLTCDNCKEKVSKEKQFKLDKLPMVATFHLKRFKNDGHTVKKISKHVEFPLELDLLPYMSSNQDSQVSTKYHLYAIVEHLGNKTSSGHYSSYVRSAPETWHKFDDAKVTRISEDYVLSSTDAYLLFFVREGTPWFASAFQVSKPWYSASPLYSSPKSVPETSWIEEYAFDRDYENSYDFKFSTKPVLGTSWREEYAFDRDYENSYYNFKFSTKPVLESSWRDRCVDHSYQNVSTSNKGCNSLVEMSIPDESQEQVFHSTDSDSDSYMSDNFELPKADKSFAETSSDQEEPNLSPERKDPKAKEIALSNRKKIPTYRSSGLGQPYTIKNRKISNSRRSMMGYISKYFGVLWVIALESALKHIVHISRIKSNTYILFFMDHVIPH